MAIDAGAEVVFVCGGDGTVMSAVSAVVGTEVSMAILAAGLGVALEGGLRRLDVGMVEGRHFAVMAGMGFDAHVLDATSDTA